MAQPSRDQVDPEHPRDVAGNQKQHAPRRQIGGTGGAQPGAFVRAKPITEQAVTKTNTTSQAHAAPLLPQFPMEAFRGLFAKYLDLVGPTTEAAPPLLFAALLSALSFLIRREVTLAWGAGRIPPVLNVAVLGASAKARKSTALEDVIEIVVEPLRERATAEGEPDPTEVVVGLGSGEGFAEAIADAKWWLPGTKRGKDDPEIQTGRSALYVVHEMGALLEKIGRDQAGAMLDFMLATFDARRLWTHRTRKKSDSAALTMTDASAVFMCASTHAWLVRTLTDTQIMAGLANRFLWFAGYPTVRLAMRPAISEALRQAFQDDVRSALAAVRGKPAELTSEAKLLHAAFYDEDCDRPEESIVSGAAVARGDMLALRLSVLLAIAEGTTMVAADHVAAAWAVVRYSNAIVAGLVAQVHERSMREAEARVIAAARRVAEDTGKFTRRQVRDRVKGRSGMDAEMFNRCWSSLVEAGDIQEAAPGPGEFVVVTP